MLFSSGTNFNQTPCVTGTDFNQHELGTDQSEMWLQLAAKVVETLPVTRVISDETLKFQLFLPLPLSMLFGYRNYMSKMLVYNIERGKGVEREIYGCFFFFFFCQGVIFYRIECVSIQSVSTICS